MKTKNLENLLDKKIARNILIKYQKECGLGNNFEIIKIHRHLVLSPKTYALLYEIDDDNHDIKIRVNASGEETRERAVKVMNYLSSHFAGPTFFVPKVFFYDSDYNLVAYENITGKLLIDSLNDNDLENNIALTAKWLDHLHRLSVPQNMDLPKHEIFFNFEALAKFYPETADSGQGLVKELKSRILPYEPKLIHGDYQPNNIIADNGKVTVFDFNDSQIDDPALDVAKFLTQLRVMLTRFADVGEYESLRKIFFTNYQQDLNQKNLKIYTKLYFLQILSSLSASLADDPEASKTLPKIYQYYNETRT